MTILHNDGEVGRIKFCFSRMFERNGKRHRYHVLYNRHCALVRNGSPRVLFACLLGSDGSPGMQRRQFACTIFCCSSSCEFIKITKAKKTPADTNNFYMNLWPAITLAVESLSIKEEGNKSSQFMKRCHQETPNARERTRNESAMSARRKLPWAGRAQKNWKRKQMLNELNSYFIRCEANQSVLNVLLDKHPSVFQCRK